MRRSFLARRAAPPPAAVAARAPAAADEGEEADAGLPPVGAAAASPAPAAAARPAPATPRAAADYRVERVAIERARFTLITDAGPLDVALGLEARGITAAAGASFPLKLSLDVEKGSLSLEGRAGLVPPSFAGRLAWRDMPFPLLLLASTPELVPWLESCRARGDVEIEARLAAGPGRAPAGVTLRGSAGVDDFAFRDPQSEDLAVAWKSLDMAIREFVMPLPAVGEPRGTWRVALERVALVDPRLRYTLPAPALPLVGGPPEGEPAAAEPAPAAEVAEAEPGPPPVALELGLFELTGGEIAFEDRSVAPPFRGGLRDLTVSARGLSFPANTAEELRVAAVSTTGGSLSLRGALGGEAGEAQLELRELALAPFNPYAGAAAGYSLGGKASLDTKLRARGPRYEAQNQLRLVKLDVSSKDPGDFERRFGMPLDVALALLRDPFGNVSLSLPVAVDEKGGGVGLASVVASALRQALLGALTAPLKMVGFAVSAVGGVVAGGGAPSLEPFLGVPGAPELAPGQEERLRGLAELLSARPELALRLHGRSAPEDRDGLALALLVERVAGGRGLPKLEGAGLLAARRVRVALAKAAGGEEISLDPDDQALLERYKAAVEVPDERFAALARARAESVRSAAAALGADAERLALGDPAEPGAPGVVLALAAR
jgi:hypothetical protein